MRFRILASLHFIIIHLFIQQVSSQNFEIKSPDEKLKLSVNINEDISWFVSLKENVILENAKELLAS